MNDAQLTYKLLFDCGIGVLLPRQIQERARRAVRMRSVAPLREAMGQLGTFLAYRKTIETARVVLRVLILALDRTMTAQEWRVLAAQIEGAALEHGIGARNETLAIAFALAGDCAKAQGYLGALSEEIGEMYGLGEYKCRCRDRIEEFIGRFGCGEMISLWPD